MQMLNALFLLLPVAALSGWLIGRKGNSGSMTKTKAQRLPPRYYSGINYLLNEQTDKAVDVLLEVMNTDDDTVEAHLTLGNLFRRRGEVDKAIRIHSDLLARSQLSEEQRALANLELAKDFIRAGVLDRAQNLLHKLVNANQQCEISLRHLLDIYQQSKDWQSAIDTARQLQKVSRDYLGPKIAHFYCELAQNAWLNGDISGAQSYLQQAFKASRSCVRASILQGNMEASFNHPKQALESYQKVYDQNPVFFSEVISPIAKCYDQLNNPDGMLKYLKACLSKRAAIPAMLAYSDWLQDKKGSYAALKFITEHLRQHPSLRGLNRVVQLNLSTATGKFHQDLTTLQELIERILAKTPVYRCESCGFSGRVLQWHCPGCKQWDTVKPIYEIEAGV